uniref:EF-hand domain-containing protein n=1 Tax=Syphacia muris TaxID=451379 RepID=A0A0N5AC10_9BILA
MKVFLLAVCFIFFYHVNGDAEISDALFEQEFKKEDKDNSGGLSLDEVKAATFAESEGETVPPEIIALIEAGFKEDDTNHDGVLSFEEVKAKIQKNMKLAEEAPDA